MVSAELRQLRTFLRVLERQSFVRAAADVGLSAPATSQSVSALEERLGVQLLRRTTRHVVATPAGQALAERIGPLLGELDAALDEAAGATRRVRGHLRISVPRIAMQRWVKPWLEPFGSQHPDVVLEVVVDDAIVDIVAQRIDAGIRLGERLMSDMIAIPLGGTLRIAVVASPAYLEKHGRPRSPSDLVKHRCINQRMQGTGGIYRWEFERDGKEIAVPVGAGWPGATGGGLIVNDTDLAIAAAIDGAGIACALDELVREPIRDGRLVRLLEPWCPPFPGLHLYYSSRERLTPALRAFVDFVRRREVRTKKGR